MWTSGDPEMGLESTIIVVGYTAYFTLPLDSVIQLDIEQKAYWEANEFKAI